VKQRRLMKTVLLIALTIAAATASHAGHAAAAIIDNGTVQLGINSEGHLNVPGGTASFQNGTTDVGLRFIPTNGEATAPGCLCEGWGAANADAATVTFAGYANVSTDHGAVGLTLVSAVTTGTGTKPESTGSAFTSVVETSNGRLRVTHDYHASSSPNLYQVDVTIKNIGSTPIGDLRYRRVMDWDIPPTTFYEWVEIHVGTATSLIHATTDGFQSANPWSSPGPSAGHPPTTLTPGSPDYFSGPTDQGALFDFGFGTLAAGQSKSFRIYYGAAANRAAALAAIGSVGAEVYSLGIPSVSFAADAAAATDGPNVFIFAFSGVGGTPVNPAFFTPGPNPVVVEDSGVSGAQTFATWATGFGAGTTFSVTNDNNSLFAVQPGLADDGTLTFTLAPNANGTATVTVHATNTTHTFSATFTITVQPDNPTVTSVSPNQILQYQTLDVTITGTQFDPGATADFGPGTKVLSVQFVVGAGQTQLIARVFADPSTFPAGPNSIGNNVKVMNSDGGQGTSSGPIFTVIRDTDGDGIPDNFGGVTDNCPTVFNPDQTQSPCTATTLSTGGVKLTTTDGTTSTSAVTVAPADSVFQEVCVTFPANAAGGGPYLFAPPDDRTIHLEAFVGGMVLDRRIPESVFMVMPDGLELNDGTTDIQRCHVVDVSQQVALDPGTVVTIDTHYENRSKPLIPLSNPLLIAHVELPPTTITVQSGSAVSIVGANVTVDPQFWNTLWATTPTTGLAVFSLSSLTGGASLGQINLSTVLFEGSLAPASTDMLGGILKIYVNKTSLLQALRKRIGHAFTDGEVEQVRLTARLIDGSVLRTGVDITLQDPVQQIDALIGKITASTIDGTVKSQLVDRLTVAREAIKAGSPGAACAPLQQTIQQISSQSGKKIPTALANDWLNDAKRIRNVLLQCT